MSSPEFAVVLLDRESHDHVPLAKALAAARKTPLQDQVLAARNAWGIVAEGLSKEGATELGKTLVAAGLKSALCPADRIAAPPKAEPAVKIADLPPGQALLIAIAGITVTTETKATETRGPDASQKLLSKALSLGTGLPINIGGRTRKVEVTKEEKSLSFYADLCYPDRRFRIAASKFDYSCLGERKLFNAQGNLKLLLADLIGASPTAWLNHGARVLMEAKPMTSMGYTSLKDLEKEERWLLTLRKASRSG